MLHKGVLESLPFLVYLFGCEMWSWLFYPEKKWGGTGHFSLKMLVLYISSFSKRTVNNHHKRCIFLYTNGLRFLASSFFVCNIMFGVISQHSFCCLFSMFMILTTSSSHFCAIYQALLHLEDIMEKIEELIAMRFYLDWFQHHLLKWLLKFF